jgi:polyisoprenoid-binding protein YceI
MNTLFINRLSVVCASFLVICMLIVGSAATSAQDVTSGVIGDAVETTCVTGLGTAEAPDGALSFVLNSEQSAARYIVEEELASTGLTEAVGETNAVIGTILLGEDGTPLPCSRFDVDLRTLQTDETRRDARVQDALETEAYPVATFIVTSIEGLEGGLVDGVETDVTLVGNLEMHGVMNQVAWSATVTRSGDTITGTATTTVSFDDYGVEKPVMGPVMSIADDFELQIDLVATVAAS